MGEGDEMFKRILVPLDGSKLAEQVIPAVTELGGPSNSEIIILGVCEAGKKTEGETCEAYLREESRELDSRLAGSTATLQTRVVYGKPSEQILHYALEEKIDIVFMSSHGRSGIMPWSLGSTVDKVFKSTSVPLVVVRTREKPSKIKLFSRILVPLDGSEKSAAALPLLKELAGILPLEIFTIRVIEAGRHVRTIGGLDYVQFLERDINDTKGKVKRSLESLFTDPAFTNTRVTCEVRKGDPAQEILKYADETECTLIMMTSHGHHGIETWALGSVTSKIVAVARQSILLVPSFVRK
jgi:nucleotide-binding universal stress UspA family protein